MQIKRANHISNTSVEQETQPQAQLVPATSLGIGAVKDAFEKPTVPDEMKGYLSEFIPPNNETKLKPPPSQEKEPERTSGFLQLKPIRPNDD